MWYSILYVLEADRIAKGYKSAEEEKTLDVEGGKPIRMTFKVTIPTEKYPNVSVNLCMK